MPDDTYDGEFDAWGRVYNTDPALGKTVYHLESGGGRNTGPSLPNDPDSPIGPMQMRPSTAAMMAKKLGFDPHFDLMNPHWAIPLAMGYLAQCLNQTQSPEGALGCYYSGSPDPRTWGPKTLDYVRRGQALYPQMSLTPSQPQPAQEAANGQQ